MNIITKRIGIAALTVVAALGAVAVTQGTAEAGKKKPATPQTFFCDMKGTWDGKDDFIFLAEYLAKDGPDYFAGKYVNPGQAEADIIGRANNGVWEIVFTYTDAGHKGMAKKATGKGYRDGAKNELSVEGNYKTFIGANDIRKDGFFKLHGKCRKNR